MSIRPYIAIFLIVAILNPFCCCNAGAEELQDVPQVSSCPHCPEPSEDEPADEHRNMLSGCCEDQEFTQDSGSISVEKSQLLSAVEPRLISPLRAPVLSEVNFPAYGAPDLSASPPLRVRFCTYLL